MKKTILCLVLSLLLIISGVPMIALSEEAKSAPPVLGDLSGKGSVSTSDARRALQAAVGKTTLTGQESFAADLDKDGQVTVSDARLILQTAVGKTTSSSYTVLDDLDATVEVLFTDYYPVRNMADSQWIRSVAEWQAYCDETKSSSHVRYRSMAEQKERYDAAFFENRQLLLLNLSQTDVIPEGIRIKGLFDNGVYVQPDIRYTGKSNWPLSTVVAVTVEKNLTASDKVSVQSAFTLSPLAVEGKPALSSYKVGAQAYWGGDEPPSNGRIYQVVQVDTRAQLEGLMAELQEKIAPAELDQDLMRYFELHDERFFITGSVVVVTYSAVPYTYRLVGLTEKEDGSLELKVSNIGLFPDRVGVPSPYACIMTLDISKKDLAGRTVTSVKQDSEIIPVPYQQ